MPWPPPSFSMKVHKFARFVAVPLFRGADAKLVSVTWKVPFERAWSLVSHPRMTPVGVNEPGSHCGFWPISDGMTMTVPAGLFVPVRGFAVRSLSKDKVRSPLSDTEHPQHSVNT